MFRAVRYGSSFSPPTIYGPRALRLDLKSKGKNSVRNVRYEVKRYLFISDVNEDEWQDVDDGASVDSVEDEAEEEAAQQDVDMVTSLVIL